MEQPLPSTDQIFQQQKEKRWINKQRTLIVCSRGISDRQRHLMLDLIALMPHSKKEAKLEKRDIPNQIMELCNVHSCCNFIYFESRKQRDLYVWIGRFPNGPSLKFQVENVHTSQELKLAGNCLKGSRPVLSFDASFKDLPHLQLIREVFTHVFNVPKFHPKSKPGVDHCFSFIQTDQKIWFRNYQIFSEQQNKVMEKQELYEIGPRFVLNPICILDGCMLGSVLYKNPKYVSSNELQAKQKRKLAHEQVDKLKKKFKREEVLQLPVEEDEADDIYENLAKTSQQQSTKNNEDDFQDVSEDSEEMDQQALLLQQQQMKQQKRNKKQEKRLAKFMEQQNIGQDEDEQEGELDDDNDE